MTEFSMSFVDPQERNVQILPVGFGGQSAYDLAIVVPSEYTKRLYVAWSEASVIRSGLLDDESFVVGIGVVCQIKVHGMFFVEGEVIVTDFFSTLNMSFDVAT
ncbi:hypothetical protein SAMN05192543_104155 [Paraburkholderia megapolitana]|uniref:Uncharacterized protein n=1 Tax=Paraburkholderia megapolitana TaxID=420953 RepID=A0A1I3KWU6_9BURK|nr:hypothetical protein SAMN05192543_104155 [Paraburkholderia megapolitana]